MDIEYKGANCVIVKSKKVMLVIDPTENVKIGDGAIVIATQAEFAPANAPFVIGSPGEYEVNDVSIQGIAVKKHIDPDGKNATMYRIELDGTRLAVLGHIEAPLSDDDLEALGVIDIAIVPVGGGGYTLDARDAAAVVRQLSPRAVIPTHYADATTKYEVPQESVELFTKEMGAAHEKAAGTKIKNGALPEVLTIFELGKS
ncbi:MAG: MBL fold metallo-hydrolase [Candidatus Nomurabacteria bacterium]|nr:MBL fold metallo-hydrolase [Candidatus Nomurabacteria bacterium]